MKKIELCREQIGCGSLILVNREHGLEKDTRQGLVPVHGRSDMLLQRQAEILLEQLMNRIDGWSGIVPVSAWRSMGEQQQIWDDTIKSSGQKFTETFVAVPGHSEHQTGLAIDLGKKMDTIDFICPEFPDEGVCGKFKELAAEYGYIERYPKNKEEVTGIGCEPWHFRYVGAPHARIMREKGMVLEEYVTFIREFDRNHPFVWTLGQHQICISYQPWEPGSVLLLEEDQPWSLSGDNVGGMIVTEWRQSGGQKRAVWGA